MAVVMMSDDLMGRIEAALRQAEEAASDLAELRNDFEGRSRDIQQRLQQATAMLDTLLTVARSNSKG